jgi:uncharacterized membrane protein YidH (DUF202 family)
MYEICSSIDMLMRISRKRKKQYQYQTPVGWLMLAAALLMVYLSQKLTSSMGEDKKKSVQGVFLFIAVVLLIASVSVDKSLANK